MAGSKFPIGIEPRNFPSNVADAVNFDAQALTDDKVQETVQVDYKVPRSISRPDIAKDLVAYQERVQPIEAEATNIASEDGDPLYFTLKSNGEYFVRGAFSVDSLDTQIV